MDGLRLRIKPFMKRPPPSASQVPEAANRKELSDDCPTHMRLSRALASMSDCTQGCLKSKRDQRASNPQPWLFTTSELFHVLEDGDSASWQNQMQQMRGAPRKSDGIYPNQP